MELISAVFELSLDRLSKAGVIAGIVVIAIGMILLIISSNINRLLMTRFRLKRNYNIHIKILAGIIVLAGALTAVFSI